MQEKVASRVLLVVFWYNDVSSRGRRGWRSLEDLPVTSDSFLQEVDGSEDGFALDGATARASLRTSPGVAGVASNFTVETMEDLKTSFCRDVQCRRGVGLPVTGLPVDVTDGMGPILGEDEAIKAGLVGPFSTPDEGESRI